MRSEIGMVNGISYKLVYDRMCNVGAWHWRRFRWFLWIKINKKWDFQGDFGTKRESIDHLKSGVV